MALAFMIICIHFVADFILQDISWTTNKSKSNWALTSHVLVYSIIWFIVSPILFGLVGRSTETNSWYIYSSALFASITFITHFCIDYVSSRMTSKLFAKKKYGEHIPNFGAFTIIGFDQVLHYGQLFLTLYILSKVL